MSIDFHFAWQTLIDGWPLFGYGIAMTLTFAIVGTVAGLIIGLLLGAIRSLEKEVWQRFDFFLCLDF